MRWPALLLTLALTVCLPATVAAQPATPAAASVHARARAGANTRLSLDSTHLFVPVGAVAPGSVVALGVGGVPAADGSRQRSGVVVSAAGGLRSPVVVLIEPSPADRAAVGSATPALRASAETTSFPCATEGRRLACPVSRVGAYLLDATAEPPPSSPLVRAALDGLDEADGGGISPLAARLLVILVAAIAGGGLAWFLSRSRSGSGEPTGPA